MKQTKNGGGTHISSDSWVMNGCVPPSVLGDMRRAPEADADPDRRDANGLTPFLSAVFTGAKEETLELLVSAQADVSMQDDRGVGALHFASLHGDTYLQRWLLQHKALRAMPSRLFFCLLFMLSEFLTISHVMFVGHCTHQKASTILTWSLVSPLVPIPFALSSLVSTCSIQQKHVF